MKGQTKSVSKALTKHVTDHLELDSTDQKAVQAINFLKKIITPQLPEDDIKDPDEYTNFLRAQSAVKYRISVNLFFSIYMLCYNMIIVDEELADKYEMFEVGDKIYRWQLLKDYDGNRFSGVDDFIVYLSGEIGSSRATVWRKVSLIRNLLGLGIEIEDAYEIYSLGSFTVSNVMKTIGEFREGKMVEITPVVARKFISSKKVMDSKKGKELEELWEEGKTSQRHYSRFLQEAKPYVRHMVEDFSQFEETSELREWENTVVLEPDYTYRIENDALIIKVVNYEYDPETDTKFVKSTSREALIPTSSPDGSISDEVIKALDKHLPLRRRSK